MKEIKIDWSLQPRDSEEGRWIACVFSIIQNESGSALRYPYSQFLIPIILSAIDGLLCGKAVRVDGLPTHIKNPTTQDRDHITEALSNAGFISVGRGEGTSGKISARQRLTDILGKRKSELLNHSRPISLHTWSDHPGAIELTETIYAVHFGPRQSKVKSKLLRLLVLELYLAWMANPTLKLTVSRDNNDYPKSRYNGMGVTKTIISVLDRLQEAELIRQADGFRDPFSNSGKVSRIWPTGQLISMFKNARFGLRDIDLHHSEETIVLNRPISGKKIKEKIAYLDNDETHRMRALLNHYNSLLGRTSITMPGYDGFLECYADGEDDDDSRYVSLHDPFVYRVFNQGSFETGGRFYGGWWQELPRKERKHILIDGKETEELDFSGMLPALLYAEAEIDYWSDIGVDPYALDNLPQSLATIATRKFCKKLFIAAINATSEQKAMKSMLTKGLTLTAVRSVLTLLKSKHQPIAAMFGSGVGAQMMNREAQITEKIIEHLTRQDIPVLTIHDGYIVARQHKTELMDQMRTAFRAVAGVIGIHIHT